MAQTQDLEILSKEIDAYAHTPAQRTEMRIQLAQAEQTSRLADAVEGVLNILELSTTGEMLRVTAHVRDEPL